MLSKKDIKDRRERSLMNLEIDRLLVENEKLREEIKELNRLIDDLREDQFDKLPF